MFTAWLFLWLASTPLVAGMLLVSLQTAPALPVVGELPPAQAIVILSAGQDLDAPEYGRAMPDNDTLTRIAYGAHLQHRTALPILVTGGAATPGSAAVAQVMLHTLESQLGARVRWTDERAMNTHENARNAAAILSAEGIERIYLVTHAWHMPRALRSFEAEGLDVVPAPTGFRDRPWRGPRSLIPRWSAIRDTYRAAHEWVGRLYYLAAY
ncbi:YdcF family protein [Haliangium ochraceum]|nr:YdcF family protein [Haliangium ochraceum]